VGRLGPRRLGGITLVTALIFATVACGADHAGRTAGAPLPAAAPTAATAATVDTAQLESALLQASDVPAGFDVETHGDGSQEDGDVLTAVDPACQPVLDELAPDPGTGAMELPHADVGYQRNQTARVGHQLAVSPDAVERFRNARRTLTAACGGHVAFRTDGGSGQYVLRPGPRMGADAIYLRSHLQTRAGGRPATVDGFVVFVRIGDVVSIVSVHTSRVPQLGIDARRAPRFTEAVLIARRATRRLRRALR
jgi:hypothetical protein